MALPNVKRDTIEHLTESFIARYVTDSDTRWKLTQTIYQMNQGQTPVLDYITKVRKKARITKL